MSAPASTLPRGGSPETATTAASGSPMHRRDAPQALQLRPETTVFRNPSSLTDSSGAQSIVEPIDSGVTYAQVVFPPDKRKRDDGSTSPKRLAVPANVPLHHLSESDVRAQLGTLRSFNPAKPLTEELPHQAEGHDVPGNLSAVSPLSRTAENAMSQQDVLDLRPQSPETDF